MFLLIDFKSIPSDRKGQEERSKLEPPGTAGLKTYTQHFFFCLRYQIRNPSSLLLRRPPSRKLLRERYLTNL